MYRFGKPARRHRRYLPAIIVALVVIGLMTGGYFLFINQSQKAPEASSTKPLVTTIKTAPNGFAVDKPSFTMTLPGKWQEQSTDNDNYNNYKWAYLGKDSTGRFITVYVDTIPANLAINYVVPIQAEGNHLEISDQSDNCTNFTGNASNGTNHTSGVSSTQATLPARWKGVNFICDNATVSHQIVGTGSSDGINTVSVTGANYGKHQYFFVFEDDNYHPDYSVFSNILTSFKAK